MKILKNIYTQYWFNEPRSSIMLAANKFFCRSASILYTFKYNSELKKTKRYLKKTVKERAGKKVFVFANGPSLGDINFDKVSKLKKEGYDVIAINSFVSKSASQLKPDHVVFADKIHFGLKNTKSKQYAEDLNWCMQNNVKIYIPAQYCNIVEYENKFAFNAFVNVHAGNTSDITKPLGYYPLTALYALSLAESLGYKEIYIAGFDNSYFKDFDINEDNDLILHHKHYYDFESQDTTVARDWCPTSEVFFDFYRHFFFIEKIVSKGRPFINVSKKTYLNSIDRKMDLDIYN